MPGFSPPDATGESRVQLFPGLAAKSLAGVDASRFEPGSEPLGPLGRGSVRKGFRMYGATRSALQPVVSYRGGGAEGRLHVGLIDQPALLRAVGPDSRQA